MSYGLVGLYALYLIFVGSNGNSKELKTYLSADAKGFSAWLIAILVLRALYISETLRPVVKPFIGLAILTFTLKNYGVIASQVNEITGLNLPGNNGTTNQATILPTSDNAQGDQLNSILGVLPSGQD